MPSAMVGNTAAQSAVLDLGSGSHNDTMKQVLGVVDKKVRNMEKKKSKLDDYQAKKNKGERLNQDQLEALSKFQEVVNNLEFARELQKSFLSLGQEVQKAVKKLARREQLLREEVEQRRLKTVLEVQFLLDQLGDERVRQEVKRPDGAGPSLLSDGDLTALDDFYKLVGPERNRDIRLTEQYEEASLHLWDLLEGRDKPVAGTTYKSLKDTLEKVLLSGYFDRVQTHQNGACKEEEEQEEEEEEEAEEQPAVAESQVEVQPSEPEGGAAESFSEPVKVETTEFVNRQYIPETSSYSSTEKERVEEWSVEAQMVNSLQHQPPTLLAAAPDAAAAVTRNHVTPPPASDPVVRKQAVQDLMAQMQGTYNFMQDSMLEFDGQALDPAIVSAQPMKPVQTVDLQQMGCAAIGLPESRLPPSSAVSGPQEPSQASMSLSPEQSPAPCSLSSAFSPASKPSHSGGINVNAAPFQSVQAVFNMNAPVPPAADGQIDSLKQPGQFPSGYGSGFSSQAEGSAEQPDISQDSLQSVVGGFQPQDAVLPPAGGHEDSSSGFGPSGQSFYNSKAVPRGGARSARGVMNGYRGSSNGFRGGYDGYRAPFSNTASGAYGQTQFNTSRDYSSNAYQREGYQQNYKRGAAQGPRGLSRGNAQPLR